MPQTTAHHGYICALARSYYICRCLGSTIISTQNEGTGNGVCVAHLYTNHTHAHTIKHTATRCDIVVRTSNINMNVYYYPLSPCSHPCPSRPLDSTHLTNFREAQPEFSYQRRLRLCLYDCYVLCVYDSRLNRWGKRKTIFTSGWFSMVFLPLYYSMLCMIWTRRQARMVDALHIGVYTIKFVVPAPPTHQHNTTD